MGLHFCRDAFLLQRLFLCIWIIRAVVFAQFHLHCLRTHSRCISGIKVLPAYALSDGTGSIGRLSAVSIDLHGGSHMDETPQISDNIDPDIAGCDRWAVHGVPYRKAFVSKRCTGKREW